MNEIKKCPFCGGNAYAETTVCFESVRTIIGCVHCGVECEKGAKIEQDENIIKTMNKTFESALNTWNTRAEEPQERKESNLEWLIENWEVAKEVVNSNIHCEVVHYAKYGKPCDAPFPDDYCSECEFYEKCGNNEAALLKVLAEPHKENEL